MLKSPKQLQHLLKRTETSVIFIVCDGMVSSVKSTLILLPFLSIVQHVSGLRKTISSWSVTVLYSKKLSSQCYLTAKIEPVQDKMEYISWMDVYL